ncbi:putative odorant receptor 71a [Bradysia coprophila]|uniref:putative odorant receptor 71a n=1 Tax=Bradysia coprophila TaxID=38358 RepID=UPI00187DB47D|nr:putative odorant receptor 71a [Bradysia coprophila]
MYSIKVDKTLQQFTKIFYQIGIWQNDEEPNYRKIGKKIFYTSFGALLPIFYVTNVFLCDDRNESIFSVQAVIMTTVIYVKSLYLLFKKPEILAFLNDQIVVHSIENREEYERANKKIKKFIGFVRPYFLSISITAALLILIKLPTFSTDKGLPVFISFSWNNSEMVYWLAYLFVSLSVVLYSVVNYITALIWYIMLNYSIEYELLGNKLKNVGGPTVTTIKNQDKNEKQKKNREQELSEKTFNSVPQSNKFVENLIIVVKSHRNMIETVQRFRSCFSTLFMAQIITSGIIICVAVYSLGFASNQNIVQTEMYCCILCYGIFDIFMVMYLANDITDASDRLSYCLFQSNWIEQTESCKKYVLIMGEVLKQPQQLVVLIYPMNLETFMRIIKGAYSMFNILKQFQ